MTAIRTRLLFFISITQTELVLTFAHKDTSLIMTLPHVFRLALNRPTPMKEITPACLDVLKNCMQIIIRKVVFMLVLLLLFNMLMTQLTCASKSALLCLTTMVRISMME